MTNDELEKAIQFTLANQAQFVASQQQINERVSRLETSMTEMARAQTQTYEVVTVMARAQNHINDVVTGMARAQTHMNEVVAVMADTHRHTEEKLDAFIGVLERYISQERNGSSNGENTAG